MVNIPLTQDICTVLFGNRVATSLFKTLAPFSIFSQNLQAEQS